MLTSTTHRSIPTLIINLNSIHNAHNIMKSTKFGFETRIKIFTPQSGIRTHDRFNRPHYKYHSQH